MGQVLHILLVEDNPGDADLIEEVLAKTVSPRCVFAQVDRLAAAFEALEHARFDMVMLDLDLPDSSGLETIARLYEMVERVPVIILSATENQGLALEALKAGVEDYLVKGKVTGEVIERIIGYALERHRNRQRLRESQQFLRATLDALASHVAILDSSGRIVNVNKAWFDFAQANGADYATISPGVSYLDACWAATGEDAPTAMAVAEGILAVIGGQSDHFEMEYTCHGQRAERWFHLRVTPFSGTAKRQVVVVHENITARKQAEAGRAESERLFEKVFELIPVGLWLLDGKGRIIRGNPEGNRIWGGSPLVSREDYEAYKVKRLPSREPVDLHNLSIVKTLRDGVTINDELLEMEAIDGAIRTLLNFSAPLRRTDGSIAGAVVAHLDLTKRHQMEQALIASERRIREVFDASPNCLFVKDRRGRYVMVNNTTARLYRVRCEDMIGRTDAELVGDAWKKGDRTFVLPPHAGGPANGSGLMTEASFPGNDGQTRWFRKRSGGTPSLKSPT